MKTNVVHIKLELRSYLDTEDITYLVEQPIIEKLKTLKNKDEINIEILSVCPYNMDALKQAINVIVVYRYLE
jgi:hypothetical protein